MNAFDDPETIFTVVINLENQYSIWPEHWILPLGWNKVGVTDKKRICLKYIEREWQDMRPLSLAQLDVADSKVNSNTQSIDNVVTSKSKTLQQKKLSNTVENYLCNNASELIVTPDNTLNENVLVNTVVKWCRLLQDKNITVESRVTIIGNTFSEYVAIQIAIIKIGAMFIPIDGSNPLEKINMLLKLGKPDCIVCLNAALLNKISSTAPIISEEDFLRVQCTEKHQLNVTKISEKNVAYGMFTSGSTGNPKLVGVTREALLNMGTSGARKISLDPSSRVCLTASIGFDASIWEI